jgi:hypothetical protein
LPEPCGGDLERREEAQDPTELLERVVVTEVDDVRAEVVDGRTDADGLELLQRVEAGANIVEPSSWHDGGVQ